MISTNSTGKKKLFILTTSILVIVLAVFAGGWYWWIGTPEYSLSQLKSAFQQHDADKAFHYIDYDKVFDNLWSDITAKAMAEATSSTTSGNGFQSFGTMLGVGFLESMKPALKGSFRTGLENAINGKETNDSSTSSHEFVQKFDSKDLKVKRNGSEAAVDLGNDMSLILDQTADRSWKIVRIKGIDAADSNK